MSVDRFSCVLAADTSTPETSLALRLEDGEILEARSTRHNSHNEVLAELTTELVARAGISLGDLDLLLVGAGPGSFTGLRIGFSFLKGMAQTLRIGMKSVSTHWAFAYEFRSEARLIAAIGDARRQEYFCSWFLIDSSLQVATLEGPGIVNDQEFWKKSCDYLGQYNLEEQQYLIASYPMQLLDSRGIKEVQPQRIAAGILAAAPDQSEPYSDKDLAQLAPHYVRGVAAKTIAERSNQSVDKPGGID